VVKTTDHGPMLPPRSGGAEPQFETECQYAHPPETYGG
jgi:hypothetical protein